ncbi:LysE family translocator [Marinobacterium jannaschii]|uniref:LysE family translocator n=1 Tax=Marinobacterium jannaschii TaxID=64970 RepID=UPI000487CE87|nr:LysE family transporter [Marinobacterium jannaschii]
MLEWLILAGVMLMGAMIPGANTALVLRNTLSGSSRQGLITALGLATALAIHVLLTIAGLATLINETPALYDAIRWLGSAYLLYIGVTYLFTKPKKNDPDDTAALPGSSHPFLSGLMVSLLNPKILMMFIALFSQVLENAESWQMKLLFGITPVITELLWFSLIVYALSHPAIQYRLVQVRTKLERVIGGALVLLGIKVAVG